LFFKQKTAYEIRLSLVGSEMCIRDRVNRAIKTSCGKDESVFLEPLQIIADTDVTPAERKLGKYYGVWEHNLDELYRIYAY